MIPFPRPLFSFSFFFIWYTILWCRLLLQVVLNFLCIFGLLGWVSIELLFMISWSMRIDGCRLEMEPTFPIFLSNENEDTNNLLWDNQAEEYWACRVFLHMEKSNKCRNQVDQHTKLDQHDSNVKGVALCGSWHVSFWTSDFHTWHLTLGC